MKKSLSIIVLLSIGILCTSCYSGRNTITSLETDVPVTEGITDTSLTTVTETMLQTSETTTITSETTAETTAGLPDDLLEGLPEFSKEEIYNQIAWKVLLGWAMTCDSSIAHQCYCRENSEFNDVMRLEIVMNSHLRGRNDQEHNNYTIFDNVRNCPNFGSNAREISPRYLAEMMSILFDVEISESEIVDVFSDSTGEMMANYDIGINRVVLEQYVINEYPYEPWYNIVDFDDNSFTCDFFYCDGEIDGEVVILQDICRLEVSVDWDESYPLGFIITDIDVNDI